MDVDEVDNSIEFDLSKIHFKSLVRQINFSLNILIEIAIKLKPKFIDSIIKMHIFEKNKLPFIWLLNRLVIFLSVFNQNR